MGGENMLKDAMVSAVVTVLAQGSDLPPWGEKITIATAFGVLLWWVLNKQTRQLDAQTAAIERQTQVLAQLSDKIDQLRK
jgi:hypothetical protein